MGWGTNKLPPPPRADVPPDAWRHNSSPLSTKNVLFLLLHSHTRKHDLPAAEGDNGRASSSSTSLTTASIGIHLWVSGHDDLPASSHEYNLPKHPRYSENENENFYNTYALNLKYLLLPDLNFLQEHFRQVELHLHHLASRYPGWVEWASRLKAEVWENQAILQASRCHWWVWKRIMMLEMLYLMAFHEWILYLLVVVVVVVIFVGMPIANMQQSLKSSLHCLSDCLWCLTQPK